jgi:hypothetical protein
VFSQSPDLKRAPAGTEDAIVAAKVVEPNQSLCSSTSNLTDHGMMRTPLGWVSLAVLALMGCGPSGASTPAPGSALSRSESATVAEGKECQLTYRGPPPDAVAESDRLRRSAHLALGRDERFAARDKFVRFDEIKAAWRVVGYAFSFANSSALGGCGGALTAQGEYCPTTVLPGVALSAEQTARLIQLTKLPSGRTRMRCYDPHHSFVAFDENGVASSELTVCFECNYWSFNDAAEEPLPPTVGNELGELCRALGLGGCPKPTLGEVDEAELEAQQEARQAEVRAWRASGAEGPLWTRTSVSRDARLVDLTLGEKRQLCAERVFSGFDHGALHYETGETVRFQNYAECVDTFPKCEAKVEDVDFADFSVRRSSQSFFTHQDCFLPWLTSPFGACIWGVTFTGRSAQNPSSP